MLSKLFKKRAGEPSINLFNWREKTEHTDMGAIRKPLSHAGTTTNKRSKVNQWN